MIVRSAVGPCGCLQIGAGLLGEDDIVHGEGIVQLDGVGLGDRDAGLIERLARRRDGRFGHVGELGARQSEAENLDLDAVVGAEFLRALGGDNLKRNFESVRNSLPMLKFVEPILTGGKTNAAARMEVHRLPGLGLQ